MTDNPNPADFSYVDRPNEFRVVIKVEGIIWRTITADDIDQAREKAEAIADDIVEGSESAELDGIDDIRVANVRSTPRMYRVTDERGRVMQVARLRPGMTPREPLDNGF